MADFIEMRLSLGGVEACVSVALADTFSEPLLQDLKSEEKAACIAGAVEYSGSEMLVLLRRAHEVALSNLYRAVADSASSVASV